MQPHKLKNDKYQNNTILLKQGSEHIKNFQKIATLQPYLADIEKRQKMKRLNKSSKPDNQSSSRSFRIKEMSTTSLHKVTLQKSKDTLHNATKLTRNKKSKLTSEVNRQRKIKSYDRGFQSSFSKTINTRNGKTSNFQNRAESLTGGIDTNAFFNDYFLKIKPKQKTQPQFRKNLYETIPRKSSNSQASVINIAKISSTNVQVQNESSYPSKKEQAYLKNSKKTETMRKNNFRRGKYESMHSSVNEKTQPNPNNQGVQPLHSERLYELNKKQSNLSINQQMDIIAERQMQTFYRQVRTKQIQKSLQKSTQKYFGSSSYRPVKSKNQIELYVSTMQNPSINKVSQSTYDKSDKNTRNMSPLDSKKVSQEFYAYDFDFEIEANNQKRQTMNQLVENPSEQEQSFHHMPSDEFQKQRKNAEIQYFQKDHPQLDWSDDNCQIDQI